MKYKYNFPEKNSFRAMEVTAPQFKIQSDNDWFKKLWVDFSSIRAGNLFKQMERTLGMKDDNIVDIPNIYSKIIYSGHRGSGKSVELKRFSDKINHKDAFFSVFIDLESETNIEQLSAEDIYVILITLLLRNLEERNISFNKNNWEDIANLWLSETEVTKELAKSFNVDVSAEVGGGWNFWNFFKIQGNLKTGFSRENKTTTTIRRIIKNNPKPLIEKFNSALVNIRQQIESQGKAKDIIFFIDGLEKAKRNVYEELFINDVQMLTGLQAHIVSTVPIDTYYEIIEQGNRCYFKDFYLPMIRISDKSIPLLKKMIFNRLDKSLINEDALGYLIEMSGGCPRILLKMITRALMETDEGAVNMEVAENVVIEEGNERFRTLTREHKEIIKEAQFYDADSVILNLLHSLTILEYNGHKIERKLNPVLKTYFK